MSETPQLSQEQQFETKQRIMNDAELLGHGASINALGGLALTESQVNDARHEMFLDLTTRPDDEDKIGLVTDTIPTDTEEALEKKTKMLEQLKQISKESGIVVQAWMRAGTTPEVKSGKINMLASQSMDPAHAHAIVDTHTNDAAHSELNAMGVAEIVTFTKLENHPLMSDIPGHSSNAGNVVVMTYETTERKRGYPRNHKSFPLGVGHRGAPGSDLMYHVVMQPQSAAVAERLITEDPSLLHDFTDSIMIDQFHADPTMWREEGPQYDEWSASENGVRKIAVRSDMKSAVDPHTILSY